MKQLKFDVAVIGAGLSGLTAGALLSQAGYRTLMTEKLPFLGGKCSTLEYQGYRLPTGVIFMSQEIHGNLLQDVGMGGDFDLRVPKPQYSFRFHGKDYPTPGAGILRQLIGMAARDEVEAGKVYRGFRRGITWAEPSYSVSMEEWLKQFTHNPSILGVFQFFIVYAGTVNSFELPAGEFFRFIKETGSIKQMGLLPHSGGTVAEALVKAIKKSGGDVWTRSPALSITVKDGVVSGTIIRKEGEEVQVLAPVVICNAGPSRIASLVGKENLDLGYLKDAAAIKPSPQFIIFITSDRPLHPNLEGSSMMVFPENKRLFGIFDHSALCPEISPKGKHLHEALVSVSASDPPYDKVKEIGIAMQELRQAFPNFDKEAQILRINTYHGYWGVSGTQAGHKLPIHTPIEGLYLAGDATGPLGWWGSSAAVKSGRLVAEDIMRRYKSA